MDSQTLIKRPEKPGTRLLEELKLLLDFFGLEEEHLGDQIELEGLGKLKKKQYQT